MKNDDEPAIEWDITVDKKSGFQSMRTVRKRYLTLRLWHVWLIILAVSAGTWAGIFSLGFWVAGWFK